MLANRIRMSGMKREIEWVLAADADFSGDWDGNFRYIGTDKYVEIPDMIKGVNVTSYVYMFDGTSVRGVTSTNKNVTNMSNMFRNSPATSLDVSSLDTSNVTNMDFMFRGSQATHLDLSNFDTSNVMSMGYMFGGSRAISIDVSNFDTSNVTIMSDMFSSSRAISIDVSNFNTSNVTNMSNMFRESRATILDLSSFDTSSVTSMDRMFANSTTITIGYARAQADADKFNASLGKPEGLTFYALAADADFSGTANGQFRYIGTDEHVVIPHVIKGVPVTSYANMFRDTSVERVISTNKNVTDMSNMFYGSQTTSLDLSHFDISSVTSMSNMFSGSQVTSLDLSSFDTSSVTNMDNMFADSQATIGYARTQADADKFNSTSSKPARLTFYALAADADFSGTANGQFRYIGTDEHVVIPHIIKGMPVTSYANMFRDTSVERVISTNKNVTNMSNMFQNSQATTLDLSLFDASRAVNMTFMFAGSQATTGYAGTQADADKFNASPGKPEGLTFVVKPE